MTNIKKIRFSEEQIIGFLKQAEAGFPIKELCRNGGFSDATFCMWRAKFGGMRVSEAQRLRKLELGERQAHAAVGRSAPGHERAQERSGGNALAPQVRRAANRITASEHHLSKHRACCLVRLSRESYRHPPQVDQAMQDLHDKIVQIARERQRFGHRRIHNLLRPSSRRQPQARIPPPPARPTWLCRRKKGKRPVNERVPLKLARTVNEVWSMDFVSDSLSGGRRLKYLTVADAFSHKSGTSWWSSASWAST